MNSIKIATTSLSKIKRFILKRCIASLTVDPLKTNFDDYVSIRGHGFEPDSNVTVRARLQVPNEQFDFSSQAHIRTLNDGSFDLAGCPSEGGSYTGIAPMGLFWSMTRHNDDAAYRFQLLNGSASFPYTFSVFENKVDDFSSNCLASATCERFLIDDRVSRIQLTSGPVRGTLFIPKTDKRLPAVMTMQGGIKQKQVSEDFAVYLASKGFVALALSYFGSEDLPKTYNRIDLEYFERAVWFLRNLAETNNKIGVFGTSKGAEIVLSMMAHRIEVDAAVWANGPLFSFGGSTNYKGASTEGSYFDLEAVTEYKENVVNALYSIADPRDHPSSIHPFYRSPANLFMVVSEDDSICRSGLYADIAEDIMKATGKRNYTIKRYPGVGHLIDLPHTPVCTINNHPMVPHPKLVYYGGEDRAQHAKSQLQIWKDCVEFLTEKLDGY